MVDPAHTAGELKMATYHPEATFGVIPTDVLHYLGGTLNLDNDSDDQGVFLSIPGSTSDFAFQRGPYNKGFTLKYLARAGGAWGDWRDFIAKYGWGSVTAMANHLDSFTFCAYIASASAYEIYCGCKINKASISGTLPGQYLEFEAKVLAMFHTTSASKTLTDIQSVTLGADPSEPTEAYLYWDANHQINVNAGGLATFYPKKWTWSVDNKLDRNYGIKVGADGVKYPLALELHEDQREITYEGELVLKGKTWDDYKRSGAAITALTVPVDNETVTLSGGKFVPSSYRKIGQKMGSDSFRGRFTTLAIA